jgi:hypothetical protein
MITVDRVEGDVAVLIIDGATLELPARLLPAGAGEGAVLRLTFDPDATAAALAEAEARLRRLQARAAPPDVIDL